jgi:RNA polymerase sigma-70 factor, ECF subfamily
MPMGDDDRLMILIQEGNADAFGELVARYRESLLGFFFRNTRDIQLAEDLSQETLFRVHNQAWDYLPRQKFRGWMFRIARNLLIDNVRRQSHDALIKAVKGTAGDDQDPLSRLAGDVISPEEVANQRELSQIVDELLDEVPEDQRITFTLHHFAELPLAEVADIMETNVATAKSRLRLAREKLREKLHQRGVRAAGGGKPSAGTAPGPVAD